MIDQQRFESLEARVGFLEREADGEKRVTRHILEQTRANSEDLAKLMVRSGRVEDKVEKLEGKFDTFVADFPKIVADVVRDVVGLLLAGRKN